ncbi:MAG: hypothetical protein LQ341_007182, partial [Variospora aurantia]
MADQLLLSTTSPKASHGRGGVGNIGTTVNDSAKPAALITPTLKSPIYTTGRGGSGNMKRNDPGHPEVARRSQDVIVPPPAKRRMSGAGGGHIGRGGVANVLRPSIEDVMQGTNKHENALVAEGLEYERRRGSSSKGGGFGHGQQQQQQQQRGDWWRDEMATGKVGRQ